MAEKMEKTGQILQMQLKRFSRVEKAFYFSIYEVDKKSNPLCDQKSEIAG
ncbi:cell division protein FtsL [Streptococcus pneumoniae]|nr:cell division protein FtsL [Streptococcus pneumoniae]